MFRFACKSLSVTLMEERRFKMLRIRTWVQHLDLREYKKIGGEGEYYIMRSFIMCTLHQMLLG